MKIFTFAFTNYGYKSYAENLILNCREKNVDLYMFCIDKESYDYFVKKNYINICFIHNLRNVPKEISNYSTSNFQKITFAKLDVISYVLSIYKEYDYFFFIDSDIYINNNPISYLEELANINPHIDIFFQCDEDTRDNWMSHEDCKNFCTGCMFFKNNALQNMMLYRNYQDWDKFGNDQFYINDYLRKTPYISKITLNKRLFPNGVFIREPAKDYILLHYNYLIGSHKMQEMKNNGHWLLPYETINTFSKNPHIPPLHYNNEQLRDKYIVLHNQKDCGLFAHINAVLSLIWLFKHNVIKGFIFDATDGLYSKNKTVDWFTQYFEPISMYHPYTDNEIIDSKEFLDISITNLGRDGIYPNPYNLLQISKWFATPEENYENMKEFKLLPQISNKISLLTDSSIGVHYRGTDKFIEAEFISHDRMIEIIRPFNCSQIYVATDEQQFLDRMIEEFPNRVVYQQDCIRSDDNKPIHFNCRTPYELGEQVIIDCWRLSQCSILIRNSSNVSLIAEYLGKHKKVINVEEFDNYDNKTWWRKENVREWSKVLIS